MKLASWYKVQIGLFQVQVDTASEPGRWRKCLTSAPPSGQNLNSLLCETRSPSKRVKLQRKEEAKLILS